MLFVWQFWELSRANPCKLYFEMIVAVKRFWEAFSLLEQSDDEGVPVAI